ncbi:MAG: prepilin-type N-terminal cleavage/methylation domain-containing protein [Oscillospiraceae bacterium]|nr:prepilin-type N-terminal cleavage/methylation domain-containing protein [Oscillospiraceae bacterium]
MREKKGFTVVEILLVIVILLLITAFTVPPVFAKVQQARDSAAAATLENVISIYHMADEFAALKGLTPPEEALYTVRIPAEMHQLETAYGAFIKTQLTIAFEGKLDGLYTIERTKDQYGECLVATYAPADGHNMLYTWENGTVTKSKR